MGTYAGGKYASSHTTAIEPAAELLRAAERDDRVTKISLGVISLNGGGHASLRCTAKPAGLHLRIRGPSSLQEIWMYVAAEHRQSVFADLSDTFRQNYAQANTNYLASTESHPKPKAKKKKR